MKVRIHLMKEYDNMIQLEKMVLTFDKSHILKFDQFHQAIVANKKLLMERDIKEIKSNRLLGVSIGSSLEIFTLTKINHNIYQKKLIMINPLGVQLLAKFSCLFSSNNSLIQSANLSQKFARKCLQEKAVNPPDLLVQDIYGKDSSSIGLPEKLLASILGKLSQIPEQQFETKQIIRSYIMAMAINTAQITGLLAKRQNISEIIILHDQLGGISFHRLIYALLNYYNPQANLYLRNPMPLYMF